MEKAFLDRCLDRGMSLDAIADQVQRHPSTVSYWLGKHGLDAVGSAKHGSRGGVERARLEALIEQELSLGEIAAELGVSYTNVRFWVDRYQLKHARERRAERMRAARAAGESRIELRCKRHGRIEHRWHHRSFRCGRCMSEAVTRRRRKVKATLIEEFGGRCVICGYEGTPRALHFHHVDPATKSFGVAAAGVTRSIARMREEARKCVLLCSNCHAEVEDGVAEVPLESLSAKRGTA